MHIRGMDQQLIDIYNIRNIESINIYDLQKAENSKTLIVPSMMIVYNGGKTINLCAKDKYFDVLVKKVIQVYHDEKDNVLEDSLTDPFKLKRHIKIDDRTKKILDSGDLTRINDIYRFYDGKESYDGSLFFQKDEVKEILPVVTYHIMELFNLTDESVNIDNNLNGFRNNYYVLAMVNGIDRQLILRFNKTSEKSYIVYVGGIFTKSVPVVVEINFLKDQITVKIDISTMEYQLSSLSTYLTTNGVIKQINEVRKNGLVISYENNDLSEVESIPGRAYLLDGKTDMKWFSLPWGAYYGISNQIEDISETEKVIESHNMYVIYGDNGFNRKEFYSKTYKRNNTVSFEAKDLTLDEVIKNMSLVCVNNTEGVYVLETSFIGEGVNGYYRGYLSNKYFYHAAILEGDIKDIKQEDLIPLSKKDTFLTGADFLNRNKILRLVKGDE